LLRYWQRNSLALVWPSVRGRLSIRIEGENPCTAGAIVMGFLPFALASHHPKDICAAGSAKFQVVVLLKLEGLTT
jgi:hypothetical protein